MGQKGIEPHEVGEPAFERVTLVPFQSGEASESGYLRGVEPVERCAFDEIEAREGFYFTQIEDGKTEEVGLELVKEIRVGAFLQDGRLEIRLKSQLDLLGLVREVENHGSRLAGAGPVEAGEGLDRAHSAELFVHVHGMQEGLVEARSGICWRR